MDSTPLLATMVGKRVLVEWVGVAPPQPEEDDDDEELREEWPDDITYRSHQVGKMGAVILVGYNDLGIEVRTGLDDWPFFISWGAVLQIEPLE